MANEIDEMFELAAGASENKGEGEAAAKYVSGGPIAQPKEELTQTKTNEAQIAAQKQAEAKRLAEEKVAKQKSEAEQQARAKQQAEADRQAAEKELYAKQQAEAEANRIAAEKQVAEQQARAKQQAEAERQAAEAKRVAEEKAAQELATRKAEEARQAQEAQRIAAEKQAAEAPFKNGVNERSVAIIVHVLDVYRDLDSDIQKTVQAFFSEEDENRIVTRVLNETNKTREALMAVVSAQKATQVERAFFLVSLNDELLENMGKLMSQYMKAELNIDEVTTKKIDYCRSLEKVINSMSEEQRSHLTSLQSLLEYPRK